uniref:Cytochrome P450 n=1 Tax=Timema douglasi TaxID=61478 RepID=A0A7R8VGL1_TIMDO|nr:unnamed protein product [Timema douglasi]
MDRSYWGDLGISQPENIFVPSITVGKGEVLPLGQGKRSCVGESLARVNLFVTFTSLPHNYVLRLPEGVLWSSMEPLGILALERKYGNTAFESLSAPTYVRAMKPVNRKTAEYHRGQKRDSCGLEAYREIRRDEYNPEAILEIRVTISLQNIDEVGHDVEIGTTPEMTTWPSDRCAQLQTLVTEKTQTWDLYQSEGLLAPDDSIAAATTTSTGCRGLPKELEVMSYRSQCGFVGRNPLVCCELSSRPVITTQPPVVLSEKLSEPPKDVTGDFRLSFLPRRICGKKGTANRIIGGNKTAINEYPWMALVGYSTSEYVPFNLGT